MLKKAGHILLIVMLVFATSGITIYRHYCCGRFVTASVYSTTSHCCETNCPGCRNEIINLRITDQFDSFQNQMDFHTGFKTLLKQYSLPVLLAFSTVPGSGLFNETQGDHSIKPYLNYPVFAGNSHSLLQVFLL